MIPKMGTFWEHPIQKQLKTTMNNQTANLADIVDIVNFQPQSSFFTDRLR